MSRTLRCALTAVVLLAACGPKSADTATDPNSAKAEEYPKVPRVMGLELGRAVDAMGMISGGVRDSFTPQDTVHVSVVTENVGLGTKIEVSFHDGDTHLATAEAVAPAPDSSGKAMIALKLVPTKPWKLGKFQVRVELDGKEQMAKEIIITKTGEHDGN